MRIFDTMKLVEMYNERATVNRYDEGIDGLFKFKRAIAGDQAHNEGMFVPMDSVKQIGLQPWEVARQLTKQNA